MSLSWRLGNLLVTKLPPLCSLPLTHPAPLRSAAASPSHPAAPGRSRDAPCSSPEHSNKGSADSLPAHAHRDNFSRPDDRSQFRTPKSLLGLSASEWSQKIAAQADPRLPISSCRPRFYPLSSVSAPQVLHSFIDSRYWLRLISITPSMHSLLSCCFTLVYLQPITRV
jgi:hypothetical protein